MNTRTVKVGNVLIGGGSPIVVQTMCNTHTSDVESTLAQCRRLSAAGAQIIRLTVPGICDIAPLRQIHTRLREEGIDTPLVADIHFSSETAIEAARIVEKVRINPGNFHRDHQKACEQFARLVSVCKEYGTAIRIGLNHGSLGERITTLYGNTPAAMKEAAMEWIRMCVENDFYNVVVSLKASNTIVMVEAYRLLARAMEEYGTVFPLHLGVTEAGGVVSSCIRSTYAFSRLFERRIGDTMRVSITGAIEDEVHAAVEILRAAGLRKGGVRIVSCPRCGRHSFDSQGFLRQVENRLLSIDKDITVAIMGCQVNGPGEAKNADVAVTGIGRKVFLYRHGELYRDVEADKAEEGLFALIEEI